MSTYNPDAPQPNTGNWSQHTYQPQQNDSFYWGGSFGNSFGPNMGYNDGSRRNTPINPVNPFGAQAPNPFNTFGQVNPNTQILRVSTKNEEGLTDWIKFLKSKI